MEEKKTTVLVHANFREGDALFSWLKKYAQHSDDDFLYWDEFAFTTAMLPEADALLVLNESARKATVNCDPGKRIAFMMEPGLPELHPWMFKGLKQYAKIFSPVAASANTVPSHGYMGWWVESDWRSLTAMKPPVKTKQVSCIASGLTQLQGHRKRLHFVNTLRNVFPEIDFFGNGTNYIRDKMDGLLDYRYSIAIENTSQPHYFTEKINDCFLAYTIPVYYGCTNISYYFPERSFIQIDINDPLQSIRTIESIIAQDDWETRFSALQEARDLVLNKYHPLAGAASFLREIPASGKKCISIAPVQKPLRKHLARAWSRLRNSASAKSYMF